MKEALYRGSTLEYLTLYPDGFKEDAAYPVLICLHGYGANKYDLTGLAETLDPVGYVYVFPNGPKIAFDGADPTSRAWFERGGKESPEGVREAMQAFDGLVQEVRPRYRVLPGQCLLLGFSQGGNLALRYGLPRPEMFAGIAVLSGSLRQVEELEPDLPASRTQPMFIAHGTADELIPVQWGRQLAAFLQEKGYRPNFKIYHGMGHHISLPLLADLRRWLTATLPPAGLG